MLSLAALTPSPLEPLQGLITFLFVLVIVAPIAKFALRNLGHSSGRMGRIAGSRREASWERAGGRSRHSALERAYEKSPSIASEDFPFRLDAKAYFFSRAEGTFYPKLVEAASALDLLVFPKVGLCDIFVDQKDVDSSQYLRYAQKHVDYLLVQKPDYRPVAGIELNGPSHQAEKQVKSDRTKKAVFDAAKLPLLTFYNQPSYAVWEIQTRLEDFLGRVEQPSSR